MLTVSLQKFAQYILMMYFGFIDVFSTVDERKAIMLFASIWKRFVKR